MYNTGMQNLYSQSQYDGFGNTNVYKVTSLEEAIMKSNIRPSETVYFHQTKNEFYNVRVDINGNKTWQTFTYEVPNSIENTQISKTDFEALVTRIVALENKILNEKESTDNG
jgi:hypothetical protein